MSTVHEINDVEKLTTHRGTWSELLSVTPEATFFQSLDWLEIYWRHFKADQGLRVLLVLKQA